MGLKFINEIDLKDKRVIARFDFNVPFDKKDPTKISDTTRVDRALPTIRHILDSGASKLVLMSHLGRPKGKINKQYTLEPVAKYLAEVLGQEVLLTETAIDEGIPNLLKLPTTKIVLLENLRFHAEEEGNDREFAKTLSRYADIYVNDAFGTAHRKHASTYEINAFFKGNAVGGFLLKKEIEGLGRVVENPERPFVAIMGGAKVSDKIKIIEKMLPTVDHLIIGGAMAYPFLKAQGVQVGNSLCADEDVELAKKLLQLPTGKKICLPSDHVVAVGTDGKPEAVEGANIPEGKMGLDIGANSLSSFASKLQGAKTVLWNGPMGFFENPDFAKGTMEIAKLLAQSNAFTVIGGGDSVSAVNKANVADKMSHVSTGGGASLEFLEQGTLPGINALKYGID